MRYNNFFVGRNGEEVQIGPFDEVYVGVSSSGELFAHVKGSIGLPDEGGKSVCLGEAPDELLKVYGPGKRIARLEMFSGYVDLRNASSCHKVSVSEKQGPDLLEGSSGNSVYHSVVNGQGKRIRETTDICHAQDGKVPIVTVRVKPI